MKKRKIIFGMLWIGLLAVTACGSPDRNGGRGNGRNDAAAQEETLTNDSMLSQTPQDGAGREEESGGNSGMGEGANGNMGVDRTEKTGLLQNASPDTCALAVYYYDGETMVERMLYDAEKEKEILQKLNELPYKSADVEALEDWQVPCYGLGISDTEGMDLLVSYADGVWLNQAGEVYSVSADFASIWNALEGEDEDILPVTAFPNAGILWRYDMRFLEESETGSGDEASTGSLNEENGIMTLPLEVIMTVTDISDGVATVVIDNQSGTEISYGEYYGLQMKVGEKWYSLPFAETNIGFNDVATLLPDLEQHTVTCDLKVFGELKEGEYRLVKDGWAAEFALDAEGNLKK